MALRDAFLAFDGHAILDDGQRVRHAARFDAGADVGPLTRTVADTGHSVRSVLTDGRYLVARFFEAFRTEQLAIAPEDLVRRLL